VTGTDIIGMDIDAAGLITLRKMGRPVSPRPLEKLTEIIRRTGMKFILKGIMTPDEAELAVTAGADAIVVSNHGGRVLDHAPGTADVLADIADKVKGRITILADGGIRTGGDILKMLALGADAVMIGRPFSVAAIGGLQSGVETYIDTLMSELKQAMVLTGTGRASSVDRKILFSRH
jgi:isopentenyl diphosphate isomerase/L-lactate dehydrogenase-like FMN-dependent dehydrogenase